MKLRLFFFIPIFWTLGASPGFTIPIYPYKNHIHKRNQPVIDKVSPDEQPQVYEALDIQEACIHSKNPKCEAIIDNFCLKTCIADLCANHGSIRGMCRLVCEREDLVPECSRKGPSLPGKVP